MASDTGDIDALLDDMHERAAAMEGQADLPLDEMFPPGFMQRHTHDDSIDAFLDACEWDVDSREAFADVPQDEFDDYVAGRTRFGDWDAMVGRAGEEWMARQMGMEL
ncbi:hypothetical protein [Halobacterium wangiae]|uniref:hypothetical protein n=1 Tax=Halobacterium wangiae TaxID=2902623 RepID=UPI001E60298D|nr:hypothetical protein [Halobacterium wangiae]